MNAPRFHLNFHPPKADKLFDNLRSAWFICINMADISHNLLGGQINRRFKSLYFSTTMPLVKPA